MVATVAAQLVLQTAAALADIAAVFLVIRLVCHFRPVDALASLDHAGTPLVGALTGAVDRAWTRWRPHEPLSPPRILAVTLGLVAVARIIVGGLMSM